MSKQFQMCKCAPSKATAPIHRSLQALKLTLEPCASGWPASSAPDSRIVWCSTCDTLKSSIRSGSQPVHLLSILWRSSEPLSKARVWVDLLRDFEQLLDERCGASGRVCMSDPRPAAATRSFSDDDVNPMNILGLITHLENYSQPLHSPNAFYYGR